MGVCIGEEEEARRERFGSKKRREIPPRSKLSASAAVPRRAMRPHPPTRLLCTYLPFWILYLRPETISAAAATSSQNCWPA